MNLPILKAAVFKTLIQREYWEHRAFFRTPAILACVILFVVIVGLLTAQNFVWNYTDQGIHMGNDSFQSAFNSENVADLKRFIWMTLFGSVMFPMVVALSFTVFFYVLSSLYDERRDRSILFWKSMPVSDAITVASKVFSAFFTAPVVTAVITMITQLMVLVLLSLWQVFNGGGALHVIWSPSSLFFVFIYDVQLLFLSILWIAPVLGWLWFISAFAKRGPFLMAVFIPLGWMLVEFMLFHTGYLANMVMDRWHGLWQLTAAALKGEHLLEILSNVSFWWGLLVCAVFVLVATYIRRFRDDSY